MGKNERITRRNPEGGISVGNLPAALERLADFEDGVEQIRERLCKELENKKFAHEEAALKLLPRRHPKITWLVEVTALFFMPTRRRVDLTNLLEALDDVLVKARILDDDNSRIIASHDGSRVLYDKQNPRTEVTITRMDE